MNVIIEEYCPDLEYEEIQISNFEELAPEDILIEECESEGIIESTYVIEEIEEEAATIVQKFSTNLSDKPKLLKDLINGFPDLKSIKRFRGANFSDEERDALENCVDEMLNYSKALSEELDERIPMNWDFVASKMKEAGFNRTTEQLKNQYYKVSRKDIKLEVDSIKDETEFVYDEVENRASIIDPDERVQCDQCHIRVKSRDLFDHKAVHRNDAPYRCNECGKTFRKRYPLKLHKRVHTSEKPFACSICDQQFKSDGTLKRHLKRHAGEELKPYQCEFCDRKCGSPYDLASHRRTHTGEKPYLCDDCGVGFAKVSNLKAHQRRHQNIRNFKCLYCEKAFISSSELDNHHISHSGVKNFTCDICLRAFGTNEALNRHRARHPGLLQLIECEICHRKFRSEKGIKAHKNSGACQEFKCISCNLQFRSVNGLSAHIKKLKCNGNGSEDEAIYSLSTDCGDQVFISEVVEEVVMDDFEAIVNE